MCRRERGFGNMYEEGWCEESSRDIQMGRLNRPKPSIERSFLKISILAFQHNVGQPTTDPFSDVPAEAWFAPYFEFARAQGLLRGNTVGPAGEISRAEAAEIIYKLSKVK